jgi:tetratricopeptide (TPR) repeat protein
VEELLSSHAAAETFLDRPVFTRNKRLFDLSGQKLGRYEIIELIATGGMVAVYRAKQEHPDRVVALRMRMDRMGRDDPISGGTLVNIGACLRFSDRPVEAEAVLRRAVELTRRHYPPSHPRLAAALSNLAGALLSAGKYADAIDVYEESLEVRKQSFSAGHPHVGFGHVNYANVLFRMERYEAALENYQQGYQILEAAFPRTNRHVVITLGSLANTLIRMGDCGQAEPM